jgi:hypothetical protein
MNRNSLLTTSAKGLITIAVISAGFAAQAQPNKAPCYSLKDLGPAETRLVRLPTSPTPAW